MYKRSNATQAKITRQIKNFHLPTFPSVDVWKLIEIIAFTATISLLIGIALNGGEYEDKTAKEWHDLYLEEYDKRLESVTQRSYVFGKLLRLENCIDAFDKETEQYRLRMSVSAYCIIYQDN